MPSQQFCTGPVHCVIGLRSGSAATTKMYLGTCEKCPMPEHNKEWEGAMNDLGGKRIPFDFTYQGEHAFIRMDFTRWNEATYKALAKFGTAANRGKCGKLDIGTFAVLENYAHELYLDFPYAAKAAMAGMPPGYKYGHCIIELEKFPTIGTEARVLGLVAHAIRKYNPQTGTFDLYTEEASGVNPE